MRTFQSVFSSEKKKQDDIIEKLLVAQQAAEHRSSLRQQTHNFFSSMFSDQIIKVINQLRTELQNKLQVELQTLSQLQMRGDVIYCEYLIDMNNGPSFKIYLMPIYDSMDYFSVQVAQNHPNSDIWQGKIEHVKQGKVAYRQSQQQMEDDIATLIHEYLNPPR